MRLIAGLAMALALAACAPPGGGGASKVCILDPPARIGGPIALTDHDGREVTEAAFAGRPALIYFGFANCPDVCPLSLQAADAALAALGEAGRAIQPILITLDPERDDPATLKAYVASPAFPEGGLGLTGTLAQVEAAAKAFAVYRQRVEVEGAAEYLIDHSSFFYLMGPDWRTLAMYPSDLERMPVAEQAECIKAGLAQAS